MAKKKTVSTKGKAALESENKILKEEIRTLRKELTGFKAESKTDEEYKVLGFTIYKEDTDYKFMEIGINPVTKSCKVLEVRDASYLPTAPHMAAMEGKKYLENVIMKNAVSS